MSQRFFTSDSHFGHKNIMRYCDRPYNKEDHTEMNEAMVREWNSVVGPDDVVIHLGDFSLNSKYIDRYLPQLNGKEKHLFVGNHDPAWPKVPGVLGKGVNTCLRGGFTSVKISDTITLKNGMTVLLSHLPYVPNPVPEGYDVRYPAHRPEDKGMWLIHGHIHNQWVKLGRMINVGVDVHDMKPISEDRLIEIINDPREKIFKPGWEDFNKSRMNGKDGEY